jgi:phage/plasmid-like protein (TIGR03299 family)
MAHEVENMAYRQKAPWHGIGTDLPENQSIETWINASGMNFKYLASPVSFFDDIGNCQTFPEQKVLYRSDNRTPLSVVSQRYNIVQPREIIEFYSDLVDVFGFQLETAGVLRAGKKLWALAKTGHHGRVMDNDPINGYLLLATACDGTMATTAQFTSVRVVCSNTLAVALNSPGLMVKVPHSRVFDAKAVKQELGLSVSAWDEFIYRMKALAERKLQQSEAEAYIQKRFTDANGNTNDRAIKKVLALYNGQGMGADLASANGTAWGALSAVTEFIDHHRRARGTDYRLDAAWFGTGAQIKNQARDDALLLVS